MNYKRQHINPKIKNLRKKQRFYQYPIFWKFLLFFIIVATFLYFILFFSKLQISEIIVLGNEKIHADDIKSLTWKNIDKKIVSLLGKSISTKSIFIFNSKNTIDDILNNFPNIEDLKIEKNLNSKNTIDDILNNFPNIEDLKIEKNLPSSITLKIKERSPFGVFCEEKNCFLIDHNGVVFESTDDSFMGIILKKELRDGEIYLGENIIDKNIISIISKIKNELFDNFQIDVKEIFVSNLLIFQTSLGWRIYFNPESEIDLQITKMNILLKDEITIEERKSLQYIYLQYKDRAYYK